MHETQDTLAALAAFGFIALVMGVMVVTFIAVLWAVVSLASVPAGNMLILIITFVIGFMLGRVRL
jgi:hypothetical protein